MELTGKHVVIVGGSSGIGLETAVLVRQAGADVTILARRADRLKQAAKIIGGEVRAEPLDMQDEAAVANWFSRFDAIDHLVVTASAALHGKFEEVPLDQVEALFKSKFLGPYRLVRAALPKMREGGSIVLFSGALSRRPSPNAAALSSINAAVEALTRALAKELAGRVRVNCISPGMTRTPAYDGIPEPTRSAMYENAARTLPVGRVAEPREIAEGVMLLLSNAFMTGSILDIDGGRSVS